MDLFAAFIAMLTYVSLAGMFLVTVEGYRRELQAVTGRTRREHRLARIAKGRPIALKIWLQGLGSLACMLMMFRACGIQLLPPGV